MPNQMLFTMRKVQVFPLAQIFLHLIFTDQADPKGKGMIDIDRLNRFGHRHKANIARHSTAFLRGGRDILPNALVVFRDLRKARVSR